jgi:hypothetical protein
VAGPEQATWSIPTTEQTRALMLRAADTTASDLGPIVMLAIMIGARRGELCALR